MAVNMVTLPEPESGTKRPKLTTPKYGAFALQQLCRNVNLGLRASNRQQWNYITFFPQSFLQKHNWYLFKYIITILV